MNKKGQTTLLLIVLAAAALILFAITLNWGRISQIKTMTQMSATTGVALLASDYASYGENVLQTTLGGRWKICKSTSVWEAIITLVIAIIVLIIAPFIAPAASLMMTVLLASFSVALAVANLAMQVLIIQPSLTHLWNRMQQNMPLPAQFMEQSLQTALQGAVSDSVVVTDFFDLNTNGHFGQSDDTVSRFGFYYTERLKAITPPDFTNMDSFTSELSAFIHGGGSYSMALIKPCGPDQNSMDPHCNPCCVAADVPISCTPIQIANCSSNGIWKYGPVYPLVYDQTYPQYYSYNYDPTSFLVNFGVDAEAPSTVSGSPGMFNKADTLPIDGAQNHYGMFALMWDLSNLLTDPNRVPNSNDPNNVSLVNCSLSPLPANCDSRISDPVTADPPVKNFQAPDTMCAEVQPSSTGLMNGTWYPWWKQGTSLYCSTTWPYDNCGVNTCPLLDLADPSPPNPELSGCGCTADNATTNHNDPLDDTLYGLKQFYSWADTLIKDYGADRTQVINTLGQWYPQAAYWMGPPCDSNYGPPTCFCDDPLSPIDPTTNAPTCSYDITNPHNGGMLYRYKARLDSWQAAIRSWLAADYADPADAWCVGTVQGVVDCLDYNADPTGDYIIDPVTLVSVPSSNYGRFHQCDLDLLAAGTGLNCTALPASCGGLPPSLNSNTVPACDATKTPNPYEVWIKGSADLAGPMDITAVNPLGSGLQGDKFRLRSAMLKQMIKEANDAADAMNTYSQQIDVFLKSLGYKNLLLSQTATPANGLSHSIIYGWQDAKGPKSGMRPDNGYWHIVRVSGSAPSKLAWVRTYTKGFLSTTRCYELTDYNGVATMTVTRWDEDHDMVQFANKVPLWQVKFHPGEVTTTASTFAASLYTSCGFNGSGPAYIGVSPATVTALSGLSPTMQEKLQKAFMFGGSTTDPSQQSCWDAATSLLATGITSKVCAQYDLDPPKLHLTLKFVKC